MTLYAEIKNGFITNIIVASKEFIDDLDGDYVEYTIGQPEIGYSAGIGYAYDKIQNVFIAPQCHNEAVLDKTSCKWSCANAAHNPYDL